MIIEGFKYFNSTWFGNNVTWFTFTGEEEIPYDATHVFVKNVKSIPAEAFYEHPNIVEVACDIDVEHIGANGFRNCPSLRRVIMPGVEAIDEWTFRKCEALMHVECDKLEIIGYGSFSGCTSLTGIINLPSAKTVGGFAFCKCRALRHAKFTEKLEKFGWGVFNGCKALERITIPLKDGMIIAPDVFTKCVNLKHVDLVEGELLEAIAALHFEDWRNDMNEAMNSINQILPNTPAGGTVFYGDSDYGDKARTIQTWIRSILRKFLQYRAEHQRLMEQAAPILKLALPQDVARNYVLPFLDLPSHSFELVEVEEEEGADEGEEEEESRNEIMMNMMLFSTIFAMANAMFTSFRD